MKKLAGITILLMGIGTGTGFAQEPLAPTETVKIEQAQAELIPAEALTRVTADLTQKIGTWRGVRSCSDLEQARNAFMAAFNAWIGEQVTSNPGRQLVRVGSQAAPWWFENRKRNGRRSCKGGFHSALVYADFHGL